MKKTYFAPQIQAEKIYADATILVGSQFKVVPDEEHDTDEALIKESNPFDFEWEDTFTNL